jgi:methionyl-tRNA synthetase
VAASAEKGGRTPLEHCDFYVASFKSLNRALGISCSRYIRTTDPQHEDTARVRSSVCHQYVLKFMNIVTAGVVEEVCRKE